MNAERAVRGLVAAAGLVVAGWGAWLLLSTQAASDVVGVVVWAGVGVALHDGLLVPLVLAAGWLVTRGPRGAARLLTWWLLLLGPVTLVAVPVLGDFGARPDNPTLLPRDATTGWVAVALVTLALSLALSLAGSLAAERRTSTGRPGPAGGLGSDTADPTDGGRGSDGPGPGGR